MHAINKASPLYGETRESLIASSTRLVVLIKGTESAANEQMTLVHKVC
jgi:hypothetical protein